jgi:hypothetical protein
MEKLIAGDYFDCFFSYLAGQNKRGLKTEPLD